MSGRVKKNLVFNEDRFSVGKDESFGDEWLHNNANLLTATEVYT